jgi:hypothetical protein
MDVADVDGDGDPDVIVGEYHHNADLELPATLFIFENRGAGANWTRHEVHYGDSHYQSSRAIDIDGDGDFDIVAKGWHHDDVLLYEQLGCDAPQPTRTPSPTLSPSATPGSGATSTPSATPTRTTTPTATPGPSTTPSISNAIYVSAKADGVVSGLNFADEDILQFDTTTGQWALFFDGSDVGLADRNVDAFHLLPDGRLLLSLDAAIPLTGLGRVDDSDVVAFTPTALGQNTAGGFSFYFDGSDVGLSTNAEDVDALALNASGGLLISTVGNASVGGITANDEDLLRFTPTKLGEQTAGSWSLSFDGSTADLTRKSEDIAAVWLGADDEPHLSTVGDFATDGLKGSAADIFTCGYDCAGASLYWSARTRGFSGGIDALHIVP